MLDLDLACSVGGFALLGLVVVLYGIRVLVRGAARFERVERDKGSALFGASLMQMGYWALDFVGRGLAAVGATANGISVASLALGVAAGVALAFGHFGLGALLAVVSALCDTLDGLVARLQGTASDAGEVLDAAVDRYVEFFFLGGLVVHVRQSAAGVGLVLFALLGSFMVSYATAKAEALRAQIPRGAMRRPERAVYLTLGAALTPVVAHVVLYRTPDAASWMLESPMLGAVALVALVANVSAVRRLSKLASAVGGPRAAEALAAPVVVQVATEPAAVPRPARDADALVHVDAAQ
jgi:CDP-diacylglycerol--glycerol-3-phosphate 3-phosphatidyltransferase